MRDGALPEGALADRRVVALGSLFVELLRDPAAIARIQAVARLGLQLGRESECG